MPSYGAPYTPYLVVAVTLSVDDHTVDVQEVALAQLSEAILIHLSNACLSSSMEAKTTVHHPCGGLRPRQAEFAPPQEGPLQPTLACAP